MEQKIEIADGLTPVRAASVSENSTIERATLPAVERLQPEIQELVTALDDTFKVLLQIPADLAWKDGVEDFLNSTRALVGSPVSADDAKQIVSTMANRIDVDSVRRAYGALYQRHEDHICASLREHTNLRSFLESTEYLTDMLELGIREFEVANLSPGDRMLFVGGGAIPITPLGFILLDRAVQTGDYDKLTSLSKSPETFLEAVAILRSLVDANHINPSIEITCIDRDPDMVVRGSFFVKHFAIQGINVVHASGESTPSQEKFNSVAFAATVSPKAEVLRHLACSDALHPEATFVLRTKPEESLGSLIYEPLTHAALQKLADEGLPFKLTRNIPPRGNPAIFSTTQAYQLSAT